MYGYVYLTQNMINGRIYIGQHKVKEFDTKYYGSGKILKSAIEKYGIECFKCELLESCDTKEQLNLAEKNWIAHFKSLGPDVKLYNIADGGEGGDIYHTLSDEDKEKFKAKCRPDKSKRDYVASGKKAWETRKLHGTDKMSDEQRQKMRLSHLGNKPSKEQISKGIATKKARGYRHSEITRKKISESNKGRQISDKQRLRMSELGKLRVGNKNAFYGKHHSDEFKAWLSEANKHGIVGMKGKHLTDEQKKHHSDSMKGKNLGQVWINDGVKTKRVMPKELQQYLDNGYILGRKLKGG